MIQLKFQFVIKLKEIDNQMFFIYLFFISQNQLKYLFSKPLSV